MGYVYTNNVVIRWYIFKKYHSNLRDSNKVDFEENHSYGLRSNSDERIATKQGQRRIIDQDSVQNIDDESSLSCSSKRITTLKPTTKADIKKGSTIIRIRWSLLRNSKPWIERKLHPKTTRTIPSGLNSPAAANHHNPSQIDTRKKRIYDYLHPNNNHHESIF